MGRCRGWSGYWGRETGDRGDEGRTQWLPLQLLSTPPAADRKDRTTRLPSAMLCAAALLFCSQSLSPPLGPGLVNGLVRLGGGGSGRAAAGLQPPRRRRLARSPDASRGPQLPPDLPRPPGPLSQSQPQLWDASWCRRAGRCATTGAGPTPATACSRFTSAGART